jgi:hypothetical protein
MRKPNDNQYDMAAHALQALSLVATTTFTTTAINMQGLNAIAWLLQLPVALAGGDVVSYTVEKSADNSTWTAAETGAVLPQRRGDTATVINPTAPYLQTVGYAGVGNYVRLSVVVGAMAVGKTLNVIPVARSANQEFVAWDPGVVLDSQP